MGQETRGMPVGTSVSSRYLHFPSLYCLLELTCPLCSVADHSSEQYSEGMAEQGVRKVAPAPGGVLGGAIAHGAISCGF